MTATKKHVQSSRNGAGHGKTEQDPFPTMALEQERKRSRISEAKTPFLNAVVDILKTYKAFLPLTDRQIHYYLLNAPPLIHASKPGSIYANNMRSYKSLVDLLTRARLEKRIPFESIIDPTRPVETWDRWDSVGPFIKQDVDLFLKYYHRNLMQSQPNHIEIIGEKNTIDGVIRPVAECYGIPMTIGRGFSSLPPRYEMFQRFQKSGKDKLTLLTLSDFDPDGECIAESFARSMRDDFGIKNIVPVKVALTHEQVLRMPNLPTDTLTKAKPTSSRCKKFVARYGEAVYELEAIPPARLQQLLRDAIKSVIDVDAFNAEVDKQEQDVARLDDIRETVTEMLEDLPELNEDH
jgi:hypothetical protein